MSKSTLIALLVLGGLLAACAPAAPALTPIPTLAPGATLAPAGPTGAPPPASSGGATAGNAQNGQQLFTANCSRCHGQQAEGGRGPALKGDKFIQTSTDQAVYDTIAKGRTGTIMPAWLQANGGSLAPTQINDLIAFLRSLQ